MREEKDFQKVTNDYARLVIESLRDDLAALEHARECTGKNRNGKPCKKGQETRRFKKQDGTWGKQAIHNNSDAWHDEDSAREEINQSPLSIEVRNGWHTPGGEDRGPIEYNILLGTGGPAHRIIGDLDEHNQPENARFQYQDWLKPWTDANLSSDDRATILEFAQQFYFSE